MLYDSSSLPHSTATASSAGSTATAPFAVPRHVAIIMDGNGRWAKKRGLDRTEGHRAGARSVRSVVRRARELGVQALTLYAFSEQNWARPAGEVQALFALLVEFLASELDELRRQQIRLVALGNVAKLPLPARLALQRVIDATAANRGMTLGLCLSYGGREDLVQAMRSLAQQVAAGKIAADAIDEAAIARCLWTAQMGGDPDLVIRTSGEKRLSNFLLWDAAYAEFMFEPCDWPDFGPGLFDAALQGFASRQRRFGALAA